MFDNLPNSLELQDTEFRFREKDGYKRPTVEVQVPYPTAEYVQEVLSRDANDKTRNMVQDAVNGLIITFLRGKVNENTDFSQEDVNILYEKGHLTIDAIANLPRSERNTITNADLTAFGKAFVEIAEQAEGTDDHIASARGAQSAAMVFADRLRTAAGKNEVLDKLQEMIEKFCEIASEELVQEHQAVIEWLYVKLEEGKKKEELSLDALD